MNNCVVCGAPTELACCSESYCSASCQRTGADAHAPKCMHVLTAPSEARASSTVPVQKNVRVLASISQSVCVIKYPVHETEHVASISSVEDTVVRYVRKKSGIEWEKILANFYRIPHSNTYLNTHLLSSVSLSDESLALHFGSSKSVPIHRISSVVIPEDEDTDNATTVRTLALMYELITRDLASNGSHLEYLLLE